MSGTSTAGPFSAKASITYRAVSDSLASMGSADGVNGTM
jgi:hypothetical protein